MPNAMLRQGSATTCAAILIGLTLLGSGLVSSTPTLAAWQDTTIGVGSMTAKVLPAPTGSCAYTSAQSNRSFTFTWRYPAGSGYNLTNVQFVRATSLTNRTLIALPTAAYTSTGPNTNGDYTTTINANANGGYFTGMYSDTTAFRLGLRSTENGWTSTASTANVRLNASELLR
ncbi:hypothetical protein [Arthrobacter sp. HLT1-21]